MEQRDKKSVIISFGYCRVEGKMLNRSLRVLTNAKAFESRENKMIINFMLKEILIN